MYSAVPLGATLGAIVSGWTHGLKRPGLVMMLVCLGAFLCMMLLGLNRHFVPALLLLGAFGYLVSIASLLQYTLVQGYTPDRYLGRINSLWTAQDAAGDSLGTLGIGVLGKFLSALGSVFAFGAVAMGLGLVMLGRFRVLRETAMENPEVEQEAKAA
jgi:ENTS family enterobactin (siderophore) exporter